MFEMYTTGIKSFQIIADEMNKLGLKNPNGNLIFPSRIEQTFGKVFKENFWKFESRGKTATFEICVFELKVRWWKPAYRAERTVF